MTLAYSASKFLTAVKSFVTQTPGAGAGTIKHWEIVIYGKCPDFKVS
jgi:hypothetical protein